mmetsp:Transcript_86649/g.240258  ORF Transcript_86649/g.240258 Transcript_86649/m.240258 type:complete len:649 (+) Transcript_86649:60-2006(+)
MGSAICPPTPTGQHAAEVDPRIHFIGHGRRHTSLSLTDGLAHLRFEIRREQAVLAGPMTAFHALARQGRAAVEFEELPLLTFEFAFDRRRRPLATRHDMPCVADWIGSVLKCDAIRSHAAALLVEQAEQDGDQWSLISRGLAEDAVPVCKFVCRFGCGMQSQPSFDTCCRKCALSYGLGGHDDSCCGPAKEGGIRKYRHSLSLDGVACELQATRSIATRNTASEGTAVDEEVGTSSHATDDLPFGGDIQEAMLAGDRDAIRQIMEARAPKRVVVAPPRSALCAICFDDLPSALPAVCPAAHAFCAGCLAMHVRTELDGKGTLPACPLSSQCGHLLTYRQVEQFLSSELDASTLMGRFHLLQQRAGLQMLGAFPCPKCNDWLVPPSGKGRNRQALVECPRCKDRMCVLCQRRPFHFRASCAEVPRLEELWREWLRSGRDAYVAELARQDAAYECALAELRSKQEEQAEMLRQAEARLAEFTAMERWKAENCKCCPHCKRVIEKIDGCDLMKCGRNYHGGDAQNRCGRDFKWSTAPAYRPQGADHLSRLRDSVRLPRAVERQKVFWPVGERDFVLRCAMCRGPIEGPLFLCIDCYACCSCLKCANGFGAAAGGKHIPESHVFKILWRIEDLCEEDLCILISNNLTARRRQ